MKQIQNVSLVWESKERDFVNTLNKEIKAYQGMGLDVEIQYSTSQIMDRVVEYSALIIGRA